MTGVNGQVQGDRAPAAVITPKIRLLEKAEYETLLRPVFEAENGVLPDPAKSIVAGAFDEAGELCGFWCLQLMWHNGPLWIRPDHRGTGLWRRLHLLIDALFLRKHGTGYYSFSGEPKVETIMTQLGYELLPYKVWKREIKP